MNLNSIGNYCFSGVGVIFKKEIYSPGAKWSRAITLTFLRCCFVTTEHHSQQSYFQQHPDVGVGDTIMRLSHSLPSIGKFWENSHNLRVRESMHKIFPVLWKCQKLLFCMIQRIFHALGKSRMRRIMVRKNAKSLIFIGKGEFLYKFLKHISHLKYNPTTSLNYVSKCSLINLFIGKINPSNYLRTAGNYIFFFLLCKKNSELIFLK